MFRLVFLTFFNDFRGSEATRSKIHESPWTMTFPLITLCVLAVIGGLIGLPAIFHVSHWLNTYLSSVTEPSAGLLLHQGHGISHSVEIGLMSFAGLAAIAAIFFMFRKYVSQKAIPEEDENIQGFAKVIYNKFYVDEFFENWIVTPVFKLSEWFGNIFDKKILDQIVNRTATTMTAGGQALRLFQGGNTGTYVLAMVIGIVVLFIIRLLI
jgi:NADH-quinone oxidoreductase subunit L